ncbi:MAG: flagellar basal body-associated FliL family protein [Lachnospiraceae bacterium]|nr:flagellar basal body-associated FliL family protein [Lachnospiraceae bacterium]
MKKNLISVIILALCLVNLVLNALIVFVCVPSNKKVNNLIMEIASVLNLELEAAEGPQVAVENIATFSSSETVTINLRDDGSGDDPHYAIVEITLSMDSSMKEYATLNTLITSSEGLINDDVRSVISAYTFAEMNTFEVQEAVKKEILKRLQKRFNSQCIYSIDFKSLLVS